GIYLLNLAATLSMTWSPCEIIGGNEADPHSRPYMAYLFINTDWGSEFACGGFLIRDNVVMTAAHCNCKVALGAHNISADEWDRQVIRVRRRIPHPEYDAETLHNDIMLLQLEEKANLSCEVGPIRLAHRAVKKGAVCSVAGWGGTEPWAGSPTSSVLLEAKLKVMGDELCSRHGEGYRSSMMICAGDPEEGKDTWQGDSGGPLVCNGKAQGIVSYGNEEMSPSGVYTNVIHYLPWIRKMLNKLDM
uniref:Peptidase S1 domain-containing protein n=1 Tax=Sphenodon punctatus TaxID=8508 RepID=A0A8D0HJN9_SPHPU